MSEKLLIVEDDKKLNDGIRLAFCGKAVLPSPHAVSFFTALTVREPA